MIHSLQTIEISYPNGDYTMLIGQTVQTIDHEDGILYGVCYPFTQDQPIICATWGNNPDDKWYASR